MLPYVTRGSIHLQTVPTHGIPCRLTLVIIFFVVKGNIIQKKWIIEDKSIPLKYSLIIKNLLLDMRWKDFLNQICSFYGQIDMYF